uniref:ATP synthase F0 subunit 8 n=1 Tax=Metacrangonyx goulmimensis TaxID=1199162 RepID=K7ZWI4_9CRUS|nr:ATP synthase F0 subunit 8 [Metacrangonyx goulmimensis]
MPQMAPSLWLMIYLFTWMMIYFISSNMYFINMNYMPPSKENFFNKSVKFLWQ